MKFQSECPNCGKTRKVSTETKLHYGKPMKQGDSYVYVKSDKPTGECTEVDCYCFNCGHREMYKCWTPK